MGKSSHLALAEELLAPERKQEGVCVVSLVTERLA